MKDGKDQIGDNRKQVIEAVNRVCISEDMVERIIDILVEGE